MKYLIKLLLPLTYLFSSFCYGQINYSDAINIQQMAKELYWIKALAKEVDKDLYENVPLKYDETLDKIASEKANSLLNDFENNKEIYRGTNSVNFMFFDIDDEFDKEQLRFFIRDASRAWAKLEFDNELYFENENQNIDNSDIDELYNILQSSKVGFAFAKNKNKLVVVSFYE